MLTWFIMAGIAVVWIYTVIESEVNPILSNNFGLDIKYTSYIIVFTIVCDLLGVVIL